MKYCDTCHSAFPDDFTTCPRDQAALRFASDLLAGMVLRGKYEILEKVGAGGMAAVYRARHVAFGEIRAIKVVGPRLAHEETFLKRFRTEAVVTRRLQHPNAVRVDDLDTTEDGRPFIVMEYVQGPNLRELIRKDGALPPARAVEIARQVASALAAAHALGVTHRDIKPDNIILTTGPGGYELAKVLDFGIAKVREGAIDTGEGYTATQTGMVVGTPQYVSPEQAMGKRGDEVDGRSDIYSLGVVLYEMITGRLPFQSDTAMGMILHHLQTAPTPPELIRPDLGIPAALSDVLMRALQKDRDLRFASANEMLEALDTVARLPLPAYVPPPLDTEGDTRSFPAAQRPTPKPAATVAAPAAGVAQPSWATGGPGAPGTPTPPRGGNVPTPPTVMASTPPPLPPKKKLGRKTRGCLWSLFVLFVVLPLLIRACSDPDANPSRRGPSPAASAEASPGASPSPAEPVTDRDLYDQIEKLLKSARVTADEPIELDVDEGVVELSGNVSNPTAKQVAEALAQAVPGVVRVENHIEAPDAGPEAPEAPDVPDLEAEPGKKRPNQARRSPRIGIRPRGMEPPAEGTPQGIALRELLATGRKALAEERADDAMAAFTTALQLDPMNREAHTGVQRATMLMIRRDIVRERNPHRIPPVQPSFPPPPSPR